MELPITLHLDMQNAAHREFLGWNAANPGAATDAMLLGHHVLQNGLIASYCQTPQSQQRLALLKERHKAELEALAAAKDRHIEAMGEQVRDAHARLDGSVAARVAEVARVYERQVETMTKALAMREGCLATIVNEQVEALRLQLAQREAEIRVLKASNHVKGATGERLLLEYLERHFPDHTVVSRGRVGHEADIHMTNARNEVVVVESKYKDKITGLDVDKFYRDVAELAATNHVVGAAFVSIRARGIPSKGPIAFEQRGGVPIVFLGFEDEAEMELMLGRHMNLFVDVVGVVAASGGGEAAETRVDELVARLAGPLATVRRNKGRIERLKSEHLGAINKLILEIEHDNIDIMTCIEQLVKPSADGGHVQKRKRIVAGAAGTSRAEPPQHGARSAQHECAACKRVFKTPGALKKHGHTCVATAAASAAVPPEAEVPPQTIDVPSAASSVGETPV